MSAHFWKVKHVYGFTVTAFSYDWNFILRLTLPIFLYLNAICDRGKQIAHEGIVIGLYIGWIGFSLVWADADERFDGGTGCFLG